jgi:DNA repair protein RecO (recombination protein O)
MPLRETEAIVLRTYRLAEADKIASLFTRQMGRLRAVAAGARRTKSRYGAALEPLSHIRVFVFEREHRDLLRMNSAELIESFFDMQKDYRIQLAAQYVAEVAERMIPEREANERLFRLFLAVLRSLKHSGEITRPLLYFDYWLLRLAGFLPDFEHCQNCARTLGDKGGYYGPGSEGLLCESCRTGATGQRIPLNVTAIVRAGCQKPLERWISEEKAPPGCREARRFLEDLIETHAERKLVTRAMMAEEQ